MVGMSFWSLLFSTFDRIYSWMAGTPAVSWTDDNGSHSISFFTVICSYTLLQFIIQVIFAFVGFAEDTDTDLNGDD